jgi:hypothetical protein
MAWSWRNSHSASTNPRLPHRHSTPTTPMPPPALSRPAGNGSQGQGQGHDRGRYHKNGGGSSSGHNASDRGSKPTLSCLLGSPSTILGSRLSTCTPVHLLGGGGAAATPPSPTTDSRRYAWTGHGRPSVHTTLGIDPGSTANVCCPAVACRMGPALTSQLL